MRTRSHLTRPVTLPSRFQRLEEDRERRGVVPNKGEAATLLQSAVRTFLARRLVGRMRGEGGGAGMTRVRMRMRFLWGLSPLAVLPPLR